MVEVEEEEEEVIEEEEMVEEEKEEVEGGGGGGGGEGGEGGGGGDGFLRLTMSAGGWRPVRSQSYDDETPPRPPKMPFTWDRTESCTVADVETPKL
ncbi:hypothetical protein CRUP_017996 [Coryphaenoides rupestris]|nr:hypothetical protein CRUP_017996 [Coryphaenoides rupestris]